jgi:hypothetical protein
MLELTGATMMHVYDSSVYVETTIVGHIAGRIHPDPIVAARQQFTRDWWLNKASGYEVFISQADRQCNASQSHRKSLPRPGL